MPGGRYTGEGYTGGLATPGDATPGDATPEDATSGALHGGRYTGVRYTVGRLVLILTPSPLTAANLPAEGVGPFTGRRLRRRHVAEFPDKFRQPLTRRWCLSVWSVFVGICQYSTNTNKTRQFSTRQYLPVWSVFVINRSHMPPLRRGCHVPASLLGTHFA